MPLQQLPVNLWYPPPTSFGAAIHNSYFDTTNFLIDATGEKFAMMGRFWNKTRSNKSIRKVAIRFGSSITKVGGSALTLSLQDVSLSSGPPQQPDETQDQTVAIANGDIAANTTLLTGNLSADRAVSFGELLAVVVEFDGAGRLGSDAITFATVNGSHPITLPPHESTVAFKTASWSNFGTTTKIPIVAFECSDGSYAALTGSLFADAGATNSFNSGSTPDEFAIEFQVPFACKCDGAWASFFMSSAADMDFVLYDSGGSTLGSMTIDSNAVRLAGVYAVFSATWPEVELSPLTTYRLALKPTTANSLFWPYMDMPSTTYKPLWPVPTNWGVTSRTDGGSWAAVTETRIPMGGLRLSSLSDGAGGGGVTVPQHFHGAHGVLAY